MGWAGNSATAYPRGIICLHLDSHSGSIVANGYFLVAYDLGPKRDECAPVFAAGQIFGVWLLKLQLTVKLRSSFFSSSSCTLASSLHCLADFDCQAELQELGAGVLLFCFFLLLTGPPSPGPVPFSSCSSPGRTAAVKVLHRSKEDFCGLERKLHSLSCRWRQVFFLHPQEVAALARREFYFLKSPQGWFEPPTLSIRRRCANRCATDSRQ